MAALKPVQSRQEKPKYVEPYCFWYNYTFLCPFCPENDVFDTQAPREAVAHLQEHGIRIEGVFELLPYFDEYLRYVKSVWDAGSESIESYGALREQG
jgi:hypothetical protein